MLVDLKGRHPISVSLTVEGTGRSRRLGKKIEELETRARTRDEAEKLRRLGEAKSRVKKTRAVLAKYLDKPYLFRGSYHIFPTEKTPGTELSSNDKAALALTLKIINNSTPPTRYKPAKRLLVEKLETALETGRGLHVKTLS